MAWAAAAMVALGAVAGRADSPRLILRADAAQAAPGDTVELRVEVEAGTRELTSAGVRLLFDPNAFALVPAVPAAGGPAVPFAAGGFLPGQVYENAVLDADTWWVTASFVAVSGAGSNGQRPVGTGSATLAVARLVVIGHPPGGMGRIWLADGGEGRATYTERSRPGLGQAFAVAEPNPMSIAIASHGLVPLADVELLAGEVRTVDLGSRLLGAGPDVLWQAEPSPPGLISATVTGEILTLSSNLGSQGQATVRYAARNGLGDLWEGTFAVHLVPGPRYLLGGVIELVEGQPVIPINLASYAIAPVPEMSSWGAGGGEPLGVWVQGDHLHLELPAGWSGSTALVLDLRQGDSLLDSATVTVRVAPVNDPPIVQLPPGMVVVEGTRAAGPLLREVAGDVDDAYSTLTLGVTGDDRVEAWVEEGRIWVRGLSPGTGAIQVIAEDPHGGRGQAVMAVSVVAALQAPVLSPPSQITVTVGQPLSLELVDIVADGDDGLGGLSIAVETSGPIVASIADGQLAIVGHATGTGQVEISVRDAAGNAATSMIAVLVVTAPTPVPDLEPPVSPPAAPPQLPDSTGVAEPQPPTLAMGPLPVLVLAPGETRSVSLGAYVVGEVLTWSVAGAVSLVVDLGLAGEVTILAPPGAANREILVFTLGGPAGETASASLEVQVQEGVGPLEFGPVPLLTMELGERRSLDPVGLLTAGTGPIEWSVTTSDVVAARLESGAGLVLDAVATGTAELLLTAMDDHGEWASEILPIRVVAVPAAEDAVSPSSLELAPVGLLQVHAGATVTVALDSLVRTGDAGGVVWDVVAGPAGMATLDPGTRVLVVTAGSIAPGDYEIGLTASLASQAVALTVPVRVVGAAWGLRAAVLEVAAGQDEVIYPLDPLVAVGDPGAVVWQVSGGFMVMASVEARTRSLILDARHAVAGREVFRLKARAGEWDGETTLEVSVATAATPRLLLPSLSGSPGDTVRIDLAPYLPGTIESQGTRWRVTAPEDIQAWVEEGSVLSWVASGDGDIHIEAVKDWGPVGYGVVSVLVSDRGEGVPNPADVGPLPIDTPHDQAPQDLLLPAVLSLEGGVGRLSLGDLHALADGPVTSWEVSAGGAGRARIEGEWLVLEGDADFVVSLALTLADGSRRQGTALVCVSAPGTPPPDAVAPQVSLRLEVDPDQGVARVGVEANEILDTLPQVWAGGLPLVVARVAAGFEARYSPAQVAGVGMREVLIEAAAAEASGNVGRARVMLIHGILRAGLAGPGSEGLLLYLPPGVAAAPVWVHSVPNGEGLYIGFDRVATPWIEAQFTQAGDGTRLEARSGAGWTPIPGRVVGDSGLWARLEKSGVYRLAPGGKPSPGPVLEVSAYPNPFNAAIALRVVAQEPGSYTIRIHDAGGRLVRQLRGEARGAGVWSAVWDGRSRDGQEAASGLYLARIQGPSQGVTAKLLLIR